MADTRKITVTEGLRELKLLDSKIYRAFMTAEFVGAKKRSSDKIGAIDSKSFEENAKADYQSVTDLINNRAKLKSAIVQSNANTQVVIGGVTYTVAEAIDRKASIQYEKKLLNVLTSQYDKASKMVQSENKKVDDQIDQLLESLVGRDSSKKIAETDISAISEPYRQKKEYELIDPIGIQDKIRKLAEIIDVFESEVDIRLSISNSTTYIEI